MDTTTPAEGQRLRPVRRRDVLTRLLYRPGPRGDRLDHTVEIDVGRDAVLAVLYVDGREQATTDMPGSFPVAGGVIEVAIGLHGVKRVHLVGDGPSATPSVNVPPISAPPRRPVGTGQPPAQVLDPGYPRHIQ